MIRFLPLVLMIAYGLLMWHFSARALKRQLDANSRRLNDSRLNPLVDRLAAALGAAEIPVHVYQIEPINGLAAPDGRVFLTEGFMQRYRADEVSAEELASVIAHELASILGRVVPFVGIWLANLLTTALAARLSQRDEFEADEFASALLIKAGIGIEPQISLFRKLDALATRQSGGAPGSGVPAWLLTHPKTPRRIAAIEANAARWGV